jgi:hypothetical protein
LVPERRLLVLLVLFSKSNALDEMRDKVIHLLSMFSEDVVAGVIESVKFGVGHHRSNHV